MSLKIAIEQLGRGPCYHMTEIAKNPSHARLWRAVDAGEPIDWTRLFTRYRAAVDWPASHYYRELMATFPAAKVILTVRDPVRWYESMARTLYSLKTATDASFAAFAARAGDQADSYAAVSRQENRIWTTTFGGRFEDRTKAIEIFERHNAEVVACVPPDRLLVYEVSQGWPPLCDFLGVEPPDWPYPHVNTTLSFREYNRSQLGLRDDGG